MSPSSNARTFFRDRVMATETPNAKPADGVLVPFPDLISHSQPKAPAQTHRHSRQLGHSSRSDRQIPRRGDAAPLFPAEASAPISLPKSHIHRTPSELQLEQSLLQAEYSDVRMYARLVRGMTERGAALHIPQGECSNSAANEHALLSRQSLLRVVECRQRSILEGGDEEDEEEFDATTVGFMAEGYCRGNLDSEWNVGYSFGEDSHLVSDSLTQVVTSQEERHVPLCSHNNAHVTLPHSPRGYTHHREVSATSSRQQQNGGEDDDDCVFSLEM